MSGFSEFLGELKQRNVVRVCGVYAVTAWGVFQICNNLFPALNLPKWTVTLSAVLMLVGFPLAAVIAWAFERGPDGVRLTQPTARKAKYALTDWLLLAAMLAIVSVTTAQMTGLLHTRSEGDAGGGGASGRSIAVLPFANFSDAKDGGYFADGLTEEVINALAQVQQLKVAGRTSAFYFKGRDADLREIGRKLGVAKVMEGSVRREGDRVRVTVQLINVRDGFHIWSQTYDRTLSDSLALQTEIANTVAGVLKARLLPAQSPRPTPGPPAAPAAKGQAYQLALVGQAQLRTDSQDAITAARATYRRLIQIDPRNPVGYAGYARATLLLAQDYSAIDFATAHDEAASNVDHALRLDSGSADAWLAKALLHTIEDKRTSTLRAAPQTEAALKRALQIEPRNPDAKIYYANLLINLGRLPEAMTWLQQALATDPLNRTALSLSGGLLAATGKLDEAARQYRTLMDLYPDFVDARSNLAGVLIAQGRLDEAEPWLRAAASTGDLTSRLKLSQLYLNLGLNDDARKILLNLGAGPATAIGQVAWMAGSGDYARIVPFSEAKLAETRDPFWHDAIQVGALMTGDNAKLLADARAANPELFTDQPAVGAQNLSQALDAAYALQATGQQEPSRRIVAAVLQRTAPMAGQRQSNERRAARIAAYAVAGDRSHALEEMKAAVDGGDRMLLDIDHFVRLDRQPLTRALQGDPQFRSLVAKIDADNARMRAKVLAARGGS